MIPLDDSICIFFGILTCACLSYNFFCTLKNLACLWRSINTLFLQMLLTPKDLNFVGYTYKNFDAVKELRQSLGT